MQSDDDGYQTEAFVILGVVDIKDGVQHRLSLMTLGEFGKTYKTW
jgi:hypothetical protein